MSLIESVLKTDAIGANQGHLSYQDTGIFANASCWKNTGTEKITAMTQEQQQMQPWQMFHAARRLIGAETVARIFNRLIRSAHDLAHDPVYTQMRYHLPLECPHTLFSRMADASFHRTIKFERTVACYRKVKP